MKPQHLLYATIIVLSTFVLALAGCGDKATEPFKDAPRSGSNDDPAEIINMPDGFNNVATKCDGHGNRVFVIYHANSAYGAIEAIPDPNCPGYDRGAR